MQLALIATLVLLWKKKRYSSPYYSTAVEICNFQSLLLATASYSNDIIMTKHFTYIIKSQYMLLNNIKILSNITVSHCFRAIVSLHNQFLAAPHPVLKIQDVVGKRIWMSKSTISKELSRWIAIIGLYW